MKHIAIGSTNPVKCNASRAVLGAVYPGATFRSLDVASGVAAQPWGDVETRAGAVNRARAALDAAGADLGVGLEGGVQETELGLMTCAWCAVVDTHGQTGVGGSACMLLPPAVADALRRGAELGPVIDRLAGAVNLRQHGGAIGILTDQLATRQSAFEAILRLALAPFRQPAWYPTGSA